MKRRQKARGKTLSTRTTPAITGTSRALVNSSRGVRSRAEVEQLIDRLKRSVAGPLSIKFIKTVYYPELFKARIPYSLNNQLTALVTHLEEVDINSGPDGSGMIFFFPKITTGPCIYQYLSSSLTGVACLYKYDATCLPASTSIEVTIGTATSNTKQTNLRTGWQLFSRQSQLTSGDFIRLAQAAQIADTPIYNITGLPSIMQGIRQPVGSGSCNYPVDNVTQHPLVFDFVGGATQGEYNASVPAGTLLPASAQGSQELLDFLALNQQKQPSLYNAYSVIQPTVATMFQQLPTIPVTPGPANGTQLYSIFSKTFGDAPITTGQLQQGADLLSSAPSVVTNTVSQSPLMVSGTPGWSGLCPQYYSTNYEKAALVGASLAMEYVGRFDYEQGYISAAHLEDMPIETVTTADIDKGLYNVKSTPNSGLRMVWQPTQQSDFELFYTSSSDQSSQGARIDSKSIWGFKKQLNKISGDPTKGQSRTYTLQTAAPCIAIYWKGLAPNQNAFRVQLTRRFNMVPVKAVRDVADLNRPDINIDPVLTMQKVFQLSRIAPFGGSTLTDAREYNSIRQNFINTLELDPNRKFNSLKDLDLALSGDIGGDPAGADDLN